MRVSRIAVLATVLALACGARIAGADAASQSESLLLAPPSMDGPVVVRAGLELSDINEIDNNRETVEFAGVLVLEWRDPRQAFDPSLVGGNEKVFQGDYQFNELATSWYPQVVLVNNAGSYESSGVVLRIEPDGTSTLIQSIRGTAEVTLDMTLYPFDRHRLELVFELLGFDRDEVVFEVAPDRAGSPVDGIRVAQWTLTGIDLSTRDRNASYAGHRGLSSALIAGIDVKRRPFYMFRLVILPLIVIVLLSFSVFWMERSSLGDRISVSFIGILTAVTYQMSIANSMPDISYYTLMHGFLNLSFLTMCATVVINLVVGAMDKRGRSALGDRIDIRCRWIFPSAYLGVLVLGGAGFALF